MKETCLKGKESEFPTMDDMVKMVGRIKFTEYDTDFKPSIDEVIDTGTKVHIEKDPLSEVEVLVE